MTSPHKANVAILASGSGTTAETLINATLTAEHEYAVSLVISSNPEAGVIQRVAGINEAFGTAIKTMVIGPSNYPDQDKHDQALIDAISSNNCDLVILLGYMRKISPTLVHKYGWRNTYSSPYQATMLNTHPGLLPETKGLFGIHVQKHVLRKQLPEAGQTLHVVSEEYDEGPIVAENCVPVTPEDTAETIFARVQVAEKQHIASDLDAFIRNQRQWKETSL